jgi:DNA repair photolyase
LPAILRRELGRRAWTRERVVIGTATDAYQPCKGRYRLIRPCLEALLDSETAVSIITKATVILRDQDLLSGLAVL